MDGGKEGRKGGESWMGVRGCWGACVSECWGYDRGKAEGDDGYEWMRRIVWDSVVAMFDDGSWRVEWFVLCSSLLLSREFRYVQHHLATYLPTSYRKAPCALQRRNE